MQNGNVLYVSNLNNCPECYTPIEYMGFIPKDGVYFIMCPDCECGFTLGDINKQRLIKSWNNWKSPEIKRTGNDEFKPTAACGSAN